MNLQNILDVAFFPASVELTEVPAFQSAVFAVASIVCAFAAGDFLGRHGTISKLRRRILLALFTFSAVAGVAYLATTCVQSLHLLEDRNETRTSMVRGWAADTYGVDLGDKAARDIARQAASHYPADGNAHVVTMDGESVTVVMQPDDNGTMHLFVDRGELTPVPAR